MRFTKMHGIQNDYVYVNGFFEQVEDPAALAVAVSRPHTGIGADGLILILPSEKADFRMRMFNADGSESAMCGNGARCVAKYVYAYGLTRKTCFTLESGGIVRDITLDVRHGKVEAVTVDMGVPQWAPAQIPVALSDERVIDRPVEVAGRVWRMTCVSMGNPHAVLFVPDDPFAWTDFAQLGQAFERHALFPQRINTEFVQILAPDRLRMRVWERGSGETLACGTGACAALVAACACGQAAREADVLLRGGTLHIAWNAHDAHVQMTGPAVITFEGEWFGAR